MAQSFRNICIYINTEDNDYEPIVSEEDDSHSSQCEKVSNSIDKASMPKHRTSRNINTRLRFKVLARDNFKCCACGASPAKDPSVELHVDHIVPWSKGGETELENLQTLCLKCNLGKSDLTL